MNNLSAIAAGQTLKDLTDFSQVSSAVAPAKDQAKMATETDSPAVINEVQDIRTKFTAQEISAVAIAIGRFGSDAPADVKKQALDSALGQIASIRAKGQTAIIFSYGSADGSGGSSIMSSADFKAAMASDDRAALGSSTSDGKITYTKDLLSEIPGLGNLLENTPDTIGNGIAKNLQKANGNSDIKTIAGLGLDDPNDNSAIEFRNGKNWASVTTFAPSDSNPTLDNYGSTKN